jgi:hypothetical protein
MGLLFLHIIHSDQLLTKLDPMNLRFIAAHIFLHIIHSDQLLTKLDPMNLRFIAANVFAYFLINIHFNDIHI